MDRVFLDANVLFSASYRERNDLLGLWQLQDVELITSLYALNEAHRNVMTDAQIDRLFNLQLLIVTPIWIQDYLPDGVTVVDKDVPILLDAINARATHLLTGDKKHFGILYDQMVSGVLIQTPANYLASRGEVGRNRND